MGVDTKIFLPLDITQEELSDAVGIFSGLPKKFVKHERHVSCDVDGVEVKSTHTPSMGDIVLSAPPGGRLVDGEMGHSVLFHWGSRFKKKLWIGLNPPSTPFWIAVGKRLVDWFGGFMIYQDCGEYKGGNLYKGKRTHPVDEDGFVPDDGDAWNEYQEAATNLKQVSEKELSEAWKKAAYQDSFAPSGKRLEKQAT